VIETMLAQTEEVQQQNKQKHEADHGELGAFDK
jgi:hypothetical protein